MFLQFYDQKESIVQRLIFQHLIARQESLWFALVTASSDDYSNNFFLPSAKSFRRNVRIRMRQKLNFGRTQSPYLSGDTFAKLVDFVFSIKKGMSCIDIRRAEESKSLFVKSHELERIDFGLFPNLKVLLAGNSDRNFDVIPKLPSHLRLVILQNSSLASDKVRTLPIGLENLKLGRFRGSKDFKFDPGRIVTEKRVLIPPMSNTNPIRLATIKRAIEFESIFDVKTGYLSEKNYLELIKRYQFLLCLEGNGYENHRIWESLYLGIFPVMFETNWSRTLKSLKLPILFIKDLAEVTSELLFDFSNKNMGFNPGQSETLWTPYWRDLIVQVSS